MTVQPYSAAEQPTMSAVAVEKPGAQPRLISVPKPVSATGEVLVKLTAAAMNPFDLTVANGWVSARAPHAYPLIPGFDGAGYVEQVGPEVTRFKVGDPIYGVFWQPVFGRGTYAEYVAIAEDSMIAHPPDGVAFEHTAAAPVAGTAAISLLDLAGIREDLTVLIVGASGGIGSFAVQLAASRGARVIATAKPDSTEHLLELGAHATVDYTDAPATTGFARLLDGPADALIDLVSSTSEFASNLELLKADGRAISTRYAVNPDLLSDERAGLTLVNFSEEHHRDPALLDQLTAALAMGRVRIDLAREIALEEAPDALLALHAPGVRGKTLIRICESDGAV